MPISQTSEDELISLYKKLKAETKNFTVFNPETLSNDPEIIKVFRMLLNKSLNEMGLLLNRNYVTVSQYERGKIRTIPIREAEKMCKRIRKNMPENPQLETLLENFRSFKSKSRGGILQAVKRAEKMALTDQEIEVRNFLIKNKISFREHVTLSTEIGPLNFDFLINEKILVECTTSVSKWKAESLGYRAIKIKEKHPKLKLVAIVPEDINDGFRRRLIDYDLVIKYHDSDSLSSLVDLFFH